MIETLKRQFYYFLAMSLIFFSYNLWLCIIIVSSYGNKFIVTFYRQRDNSIFPLAWLMEIYVLLVFYCTFFQLHCSLLVIMCIFFKGFSEIWECIYQVSCMENLLQFQGRFFNAVDHFFWLHGIWDLSSPPRGWTHIPSVGSTES